MTILSTIMGVESGGGHNITQGNIGDINNRTGDLAQGYFQITGGTWSQFGGGSTGFSSARDAPYGTQLQIAQNIPVARWGPDTQTALGAAGYFPQKGETLGQMMTRYGEDPSATTAADGSTVSGSSIAQGPTDTSSGVTAGSGAVASAGTGGTTSSGSSTSGSSNAVTAVSADQSNPSTVKVTATTGFAQAVQDWVNSFETSVGKAFAGALKSALAAVGIDFGAMQNWFVRAGVILLGIILIMVGLLGLFWDRGGKQIVQQYAPKLAAA